MFILDRAAPRLADAHHDLWQVRETCGDPIMAGALTEAMIAVQWAQHRLRVIETEARDAEVMAG